MKVIAINGSPRKQWNTAQMVKSAAKGAESMGADVKYYDLIDLKYNGCISCFACKRLSGISYGRCAQNDALKPVLDDILSADALILGSPVYFSDVTAEVRALCERLWFAGLAYSKDKKDIYERKIPVKLIFTENCPVPEFHKALNEHMVNTMSWLIGPAELLECVGTLQFDDYSKYETSMFDVQERLDRRENVFPEDLEKAYELGRRAVSEVKK